jgi:branched-chain amino acid transport system ATP-binding protein
VLHDVGLEVGAGELVTVIGPNGAGKTSLLSAIMGLLPRTGEVTVDGRAMRAGDVEAMVRARVTMVPEGRELFTDMSVADNLLLGAYPRHLRGDPGKLDALDEVFALFPRLAERRAQRAGTLSGGERQMLALGRALMSRPSLMLLDEPSLGLAPQIVATMLRTIAGFRAAGVAILIVEQNAHAVLGIADRGYVLELGRIVLAGAASDLAADPRIVESYLGKRT